MGGKAGGTEPGISKARALSDRPPLEKLAVLQVELDPVNKKAQRALSQLKDENCQRLRLHLEHRSAITQGICGSGSKFYPWCGACGISFTWTVAKAVYRPGSFGQNVFIE